MNKPHADGLTAIPLHHVILINQQLNILPSLELMLNFDKMILMFHFHVQLRRASIVSVMI